MDDNLLNELRSDPENGLINLMDTYMGLVYTIVRSKLNYAWCKEDIEECVSTVFYEFYKQVDKIDLSKGSIKSYLAVIAKRKAVDLYRTSTYAKNTFSEDSIEGKKLAAAGQQNIVDTETKHMLIESIKNLGEPDSEIFIRKYYIGQSSKTIAKLLGIKTNTIDKKVSRGLLKLREALGGVLIDG